MNVSIESDEALARRLQAQELGLRTLPTNYNQDRPILRNNENPTVINARLNELSSARATVAAIFIIHFPQVILLLLILLLLLLLYYSISLLFNIKNRF